MGFGLAKTQRVFKHQITYEGLTFDSNGERDRYIELKALLRQKKIKHLEMQKEFELIPKQIIYTEVQLKTKTKMVAKVDERPAMYTCDFYYYDVENEVWVIEEVKSMWTMKLQDYILRRKLMKHIISRKNAEGSWERHEFREVIMLKANKHKQGNKKKGVTGVVFETARIKKGGN